jgi:nitrile hydratase
MNDAHDLGGIHGLGRVEVEASEPVFHADWEKSVFGILWATFATGRYNLDEFRHGIERMHPIDYLSSRYYEHWLHTMGNNLVDKGYLTRDEWEARTRYYLSNPDALVPRKEDREEVEGFVKIAHEGASTRREVTARPRFEVGDRVVARNTHPTGHTRLARYIRGRRGVIQTVHDAYVLPDTNAHGQGENPQYCYSVAFDARELWGDTAEPNEKVYFDAWESYLEKA